MNMHDEIEEDEPLDPVMERVRRRMLRLMAISIGIMFVGLMAVAGAIVYKIGDTGEETKSEALAPSSLPQGFEGKIDLPQGMKVVSMSLDGDRVLLMAGRDGVGEYLVVYGLREGKVLARVEID